MEKKMKSYHQKFVSDHPYESSPMAEIAGFPVRPGIYDLNGATPLQNGVNFTIHTCGGTSCELLLFHRAQENLLLYFLFRKLTRSVMFIP